MPMLEERGGFEKKKQKPKYLTTISHCRRLFLYTDGFLAVQK